MSSFLLHQFLLYFMEFFFTDKILILENHHIPQLVDKFLLRFNHVPQLIEGETH